MLPVDPLSDELGWYTPYNTETRPASVVHCDDMIWLQEADPAPYLDIQKCTQKETEDAKCC